MHRCTVLVFLFGIIYFYSPIAHADDAAAQAQALKMCGDIKQSFMFNKPGFIMSGDNKGRVYLYDNPDNTRTEQNKKSAYLINGDLVFRQSSEAPDNEAYFNPFPNNICVVYKKPHRRAVMGWISRANLGDLEANFLQMSDEARSAFNKLPPQKWSSHFEKELKVSDKPKQSGPRWKTYGLDFADECYWTAYLLNDVVWVEAVASGVCWGNHGDSNPSGAYDWR